MLCSHVPHTAFFFQKQKFYNVSHVQYSYDFLYIGNSINFINSFCAFFLSIGELTTCSELSLSAAHIISLVF